MNKKEKVVKNRIDVLIQAISQLTILDLENTKLNETDIRTLIKIYYALTE